MSALKYFPPFFVVYFHLLYYYLLKVIGQMLFIWVILKISVLKVWSLQIISFKFLSYFLEIITSSGLPWNYLYYL